jgi:hypothetical protein
MVTCGLLSIKRNMGAVGIKWIACVARAFRVHNRLVATELQYLNSTLLFLKEFLARNRQAKFPPERFLTKSFLTARETRQKQID